MFLSEAGVEIPAALHRARYDDDFGNIHFRHLGGVGFQPGADKFNHDETKAAYSDHRPAWIRTRTNGSSRSDN